jgi:hypothetical protein
MPRFSHILPVSGGQDEPEKTRVFLIVSKEKEKEEEVGSEKSKKTFNVGGEEKAFEQSVGRVR